MLMGNQGISVEKSPNYSTTSGNEPSSNSSGALVQQLKAKVFDTELFQTLKENHVVVYDINTLLNQLNSLDSPNAIVGFILEFKPFLDKTTQNIKMKIKSSNRLKQ